MTAAHCIYNLDRDKIFVAHPGWKVSDGFYGQEVREVVVAGYSNQYLASKSNRLGVNDVGTIIISKEFSNYTLAYIPKTKTETKILKGKLKLLGYGADQNGDDVDELMAGDLIDMSKNGKKYTSNFNNITQLAAGKYSNATKVFTGACSGDSGGPLYSEYQGKVIVVGITSYGSEDCSLSKPTFFMRTSFYSAYLTQNSKWFNDQILKRNDTIQINKTDARCDIGILKGFQNICSNGDLTSAKVTRKNNGFEFDYAYIGDVDKDDKSFLGYVMLYTDKEDTVDYYLSKKGVLDSNFNIICKVDNNRIFLPTNCLKESFFRAELVLSYEYTPPLTDCGAASGNGGIGMSQDEANSAGVSSSALGGGGITGCALTNSMLTTQQISSIDSLELGILFNRYEDTSVVAPKTL
jgi:hypothetical protein